MPQVCPAPPTALPVWELPWDEGADEDPHKEEGGGQWGFPVVLTHQVPLQEKGLSSDTAPVLHPASSSTVAAGWRRTHFHAMEFCFPIFTLSPITGTVFLVKVTVRTPSLKHRKKKREWLPPQATPQGQNTSSCVTHPPCLWRGWAASNAKPDGSPAQRLPWTCFQYNPPIMYPPDLWLPTVQDASTSETEQWRRVKNHLS